MAATRTGEVTFMFPQVGRLGMVKKLLRANFPGRVGSDLAESEVLGSR
jgi:hypothetical protein